MPIFLVFYERARAKDHRVWVGLEKRATVDLGSTVDYIGRLRHLACGPIFSWLATCGFHFGLLAVPDCWGIVRFFHFSAKVIPSVDNLQTRFLILLSSH